MRAKAVMARVKFKYAGQRSANAIFFVGDSLTEGEALSPGPPRPRAFLLGPRFSLQK
jgi:hypothetical protein